MQKFILVLGGAYKDGKTTTTISPLDNLDERYASIQKVLETPLFFDSPQVRQVINDINESRNAVLYVANQLTGIEDGEKEED